MTQGNEVGRLLGGHDPGDPGDAEHIPLFVSAFHDQGQGLGLHANLSLCPGDTPRGRLVADIHHVGIALPVEMR